MSFGVNWPVLDLGTRWVFTKVVIIFPVLRRPDGSVHKTTAAIWTHVTQDGIDTGCTERTFIGTDVCLK
jgi:hypothetical protein